MIILLEYIKYYLREEQIEEMATIARGISLDKNRLYKIAIHGPSSKDREYPHIHIYDAKDTSLKQFNFEISIVDILCSDELVLITQVDKSRRLHKMNRNSCSWEGYRKLKVAFEDWLYSSEVTFPGEFKDNLDAILWSYVNESPCNTMNSLLDYISSRGKKILPKFKEYFNPVEIAYYKDCFK